MGNKGLKIVISGYLPKYVEKRKTRDSHGDQIALCRPKIRKQTTSDDIPSLKSMLERHTTQFNF